MCHVPRPSYPPRFNHPKNIKNIWRWVEIRQLLIMQTSPVFYYVLPLRPKCLFQYPILEYRPSSPLYVTDQVSHSYTAKRKIIVLFLVIAVSLECKTKIIILWTDWQHTFPECNLLWISWSTHLWFVRVVPEYMNFSSLKELGSYLHILVLPCTALNTREHMTFLSLLSF